MHSIAVVIVNWNSGTHLAQCLTSLREDTDRGTVSKIVVVDNSSTDSSLALAKASAQTMPLLIVENQFNFGFGRACNQGADLVDEQLILFLNPDTEVKQGTIGRAARLICDKDSNIGIVGVANYDSKGNLRPSCARFPTPMLLTAKCFGLDIWLSPKKFSSFDLSWDYRTDRYVDQVIGAFFMLRKTTFDELGGFDERFFMYFEEVDLSLRAHRRGLRSLYISDASIVHQGGVSAANSSGLALGYSLLSRALYSAKHFSFPSMLLVTLLIFFVEFPVRFFISVLNGGLYSPRETMKGFKYAFKHIPKEARAMLESRSDTYRHEQKRR